MPGNDDALVAAARLAVRLNRPDELWLEFGVHKGHTAMLLGRIHNSQVSSSTPIHGFDSFRGLPESWRQAPPHNASKAEINAWRNWHSAGSFNLDGQPPFHDARVAWQVGWFNETLPPFLAKHPDRNVSLVHIDCDLYSSAASALELLTPRLSPGALLIFDELINYPEYERHELKALLELQARTGRTLRVLGTAAESVLRDEVQIRRVITKRGGEFPNMRPYQQDAAFMLL